MMNNQQNLPRPQAVVFDLDGTLVDAFGDIADAVNAALRALGLPEKSQDQITLHVGYGVHYLMSSILGDGNKEDVEEGIVVLKKYYSEHVGEKCEFYPGVIDLLEFLREKNIKTAVLSNKPHSLSVRVIEIMGAEGYFDRVQGEDEKVPAKPDPRGFQALCRELCVEPAMTYLVGDGDTDMETARAAGAVPWGVTYGIRTVDQLRAHGARLLSDSMFEIREQLEMIVSRDTRYHEEHS